MNGIIFRIVLLLQIFLISGLQAKRSSTCRELERDIQSQTNETIHLKLQLEEYKLADDRNEDIWDSCNDFKKCAKCLRDAELDCGWCFLSNKCTFKENCPGSDTTSDLWIPNGAERCPKIRTVKPHLLASVTAKMLQIIIPHMPEYKRPLVCSFEMHGSTLLTRGSRTDLGVSCPSPSTYKLVSIPAGSDHLPVTLSVRVPNGPNFVSTTNFTIYDCGRYTSCAECTSSPFPCAWCSSGNRCTHDVDENCRNDILIFSKATPVLSIRQGPGYCTRIVPNPTGSSNEILIPAGLMKRIFVKEENIMQFQATARFHCKAEGHARVTGQLLGDIIYCDQIQFRVLDRSPISNLSFDVYWGNDEAKLDNPENLHVVVYQCSLMALSCGECLDLPAQYNCGWCEESNTCSVRDDCEESEWLDSKQRCTKPEVTSFYPKAGLFNRPTNITIKGINFGREFKDIDGGVRLINEESDVISECRAFEDLYVKSSQIVCQLDVPEIIENETMQGVFEVKILNDYVTVSGEEYFFVDPSITGLYPVKGTKSGGTYLTIQGNHLGAGNKVEAFVGDIPCNIVSRDSSNIRCITSPSPRTRNSTLRVIFDGEEKTSSTYFFYVEDPYINSVKTEVYADGPTGTPSGGNLIIVKGEYFDHVQNPYMYIIVDNEEYPGVCIVESPIEMKCLSPKVPAEVLDFCGEEGSLTFDYGFGMGDVEDVQNISMNERFNKFHMHSDPFFKPFADEKLIKVFRSDYLTIEGRNIDTVSDENDFLIEIGVEECTLTSYSRSQLTCRPPPIQPDAKDGDPNSLPEVVVKVRGTQEYFIGFLRYENSII